MPLIVEVANAPNTSGPHNEGWPSAAPPKMGAAAFGRRPHLGIHDVARWYFQHWPLLLLKALATSTIKGIGHLHY